MFVKLKAFQCRKETDAKVTDTGVDVVRPPTLKIFVSRVPAGRAGKCDCIVSWCDEITRTQRRRKKKK